jgi:hypothetical protein
MIASSTHSLLVLPLCYRSISHLVPYPLYTYIYFTYVHPDDNATLKLYGIRIQ